jgi:hypothetical protein
MGLQGGINSVSGLWGVPTSGAEAYGEVVWTRRLNGWRQVSTEARKPDRAGAPVSVRRRGRKARYPGVSAI